VNRGFSLVEVVLALLVFQVGILGAVGMMVLAQKSMNRAEVRVRAVLEAEWVADSLARAGSSGSGSLDRSWGKLGWAPATHGAGGLMVVATGPLSDTLANVLVLPPLPDSFTVPPSEGS
jgi:Tfp pilus assembly protein PilV